MNVNRTRLVYLQFSILLAWHASQIRAGEGKPSDRYFAVQVVDSATGRGVPLVQLRTVNDVTYDTDSGGWMAFREPGLMNKGVFFYVSSHGYEFPADRFGSRGIRLKTTPGKSARIEIERKNVAERIYRITGQGIYRDSVMLGRKTPIVNPTLNGDRDSL